MTAAHVAAALAVAASLTGIVTLIVRLIGRAFPRIADIVLEPPRARRAPDARRNGRGLGLGDRRGRADPLGGADMTDRLPARSRPCANCPWRLDVAPGEFPAERYRALAASAEDMSRVIFTCHKSAEIDVACAGFLARGADHNLSIRLAYMGRLERRDRSGGLALHADYRAMAIADGVAPDDPALRGCR